jgi:hypothetical protein
VRGSTGEASLAVLGDGRPLALYDVAAGRPPQRIVVEVGGTQQVAFRLVQHRGVGSLVLGNPRVYR